MSHYTQWYATPGAQPRLLLVDDHQLNIRVMYEIFRHEFDVFIALNGEQALEKCAELHPDLILLDVDLPDGNGIEFLGQGVTGETAVVLLTAYDSVNTRVLSYTFGAEDFIAKPFDPTEFQVRVASRLKRLERHKSRAQSGGTSPSRLIAGPLELDLETQRAVHRSPDRGGSEIELTPVEFKMLLLFVKERGEVVPRDSILSHVWGANVHVSPRVVDHHVCSVRKKIEHTGTRIEAVYGVGYKLEAA